MAYVGKVKLVITQLDAHEFLEAGGSIAVDEWDLGEEGSFCHLICADQTVANQVMEVLPEVSQVNIINNHPVLLADNTTMDPIVEKLIEAGFEIQD